MSTPTAPTSGSVGRRSAIVERATDGTARVIVSSPIEARDGNIWAGPWRLAPYQANPVVLWAHEYHTPPLGRMKDVGLDDKGWLVGSIEWDEAPENARATLVRSQWDRGFLRAVSAGVRYGDIVRRDQLPEGHSFRADDGYLMTDNELLDVSVVTVPSDYAALSAERAADGSASLDLHALMQRLVESDDFASLVLDLARSLPPEEQAQVGLFGLPIK